jgi:hypothetical protein
MTEENCAPCATAHLRKLDKKWIDSNGEDLATEGLILRQCFRMNIDCDDHMKELEKKLRDAQKSPRDKHAEDFPEDARARTFDGGF